MKDGNPKKASQYRKELLKLLEELKSFAVKILAPRTLIKGSIYENKRKCGNRNCKCAKGKLHSSKALSFSCKGKTKLIHLSKFPLPELSKIEKQVKNYQQFRVARIKIVKCFNRFLEKMNYLESCLLTEVPEIKMKEGNGNE